MGKLLQDEKPTFERILNAIGLVFVSGGGCSSCDAPNICAKVHRAVLCHEGCVAVGMYHGTGLDGCFKFRRYAVEGHR